MRTAILFFTIVILLGCKTNNSSSIVNQESKPENVKLDSLVSFFKNKSIYKDLPDSLNGDSLMGLPADNLSNYDIKSLPFISKEFLKEYEPTTFVPIYYNLNIVDELYTFYIFIRSMPDDNSYYGVWMFVCDSKLLLLDSFAISDRWIFSGSATQIRSYKKVNDREIIIYEEASDIEMEGDDNINYITHIKSILHISEGKFNILHSDTNETQEKVKFD